MPAAVSSPEHLMLSPRTFELQARKFLRAPRQPPFFWLSLRTWRIPVPTTRDWTRAPCSAVQSLSHWTAREVPSIINFSLATLAVVIRGVCWSDLHFNRRTTTVMIWRLDFTGERQSKLTHQESPTRVQWEMAKHWIKTTGVKTWRKGLIIKESKRYMACGRRGLGWLSRFWHERMDGYVIKLGRGDRCGDEGQVPSGSLSLWLFWNVK